MSRRPARSRRISFAGNSSFALPAPAVTSIYPPVGLRRGSGVAVTITGINFRTGAQVSIGGIAASSVVVMSSTSITAVTPTFSGDSIADVTVRNADGQSATLAQSYMVRQAFGWWKQSRGVTFATAPVITTWGDQSGNGNDGTDPGATHRPQVTAGYRNGKDAINFSGGSAPGNFLLQASSAVASGAAYTLLYVGSGGNQSGAFYTIRTTAPASSVLLFHVAANSQYIYTDGVGGLVLVAVPDALINSDFYMQVSVPDRNGADIVPRFNGVNRSVTVSSAIIAESGTNGGWIGNDTAVAQCLGATVLEMAVIPGSLSNAEQTIWESYVKSEYNFT